MRVSRDIRLIVHRAEASLLRCYAGHHDDGYLWAGPGDGPRMLRGASLPTHRRGPVLASCSSKRVVTISGTWSLMKCPTLGKTSNR